MAEFSLANRKEVRTSVYYKIIYQHKNQFSITDLCRHFKFSCGEYYGFVFRIDIPAKDLPLAKLI